MFKGKKGTLDWQMERAANTQIQTLTHARKWRVISRGRNHWIKRWAQHFALCGPRTA